MKPPMIVKVQLPLYTNEPQPMVLIYNEDRSIEGMVPYDKATKKMLGRKPKQYYYAIVTGENVGLIKRAPDQDW